MRSSVVDSSIRQDTKLNDSRIASAHEQYRNGQRRIMQLINKDHYRDRIICAGRNEGTLMIFFLLSPRRVVPVSRCRMAFVFVSETKRLIRRVGIKIWALLEQYVEHKYFVFWQESRCKK